LDAAESADKDQTVAARTTGGKRKHDSSNRRRSRPRLYCRGLSHRKGNLLVLMQPAELLIIGGAALGTVLIGNPLYVLKAIGGGILQVFKGSRYTAGIYLDTLKFLNDLFNTSRKNACRASNCTLMNRIRASDSSAIQTSTKTKRRCIYFATRCAHK
jgi:hypothetical protein